MPDMSQLAFWGAATAATALAVHYPQSPGSAEPSNLSYRVPWQDARVLV
jgi:hypothetical protein